MELNLHSPLLIHGVRARGRISRSLNSREDTPDHLRGDEDRCSYDDLERVSWPWELPHPLSKNPSEKDSNRGTAYVCRKTSNDGEGVIRPGDGGRPRQRLGFVEKLIIS